MMNIEFARKEFQDYLASFDRENEKIKLKIIHTEGVVRCAAEIARRMNLSEEDKCLAELIALLHDIGRFEQIKQFDSFEPTTMDHASYGVEILFGERKMIRRFVKEDTWDEVIRTAIAHHSDYELPDIRDEQTLLHAKLIRDADKLDNCRVKLEESIEVLLGTDARSVGSQEITEKVWEYCLNHKCIKSADRRNKIDYWVSYIVYFFDINFPETFSIIREENYLDRIIDRIPYTNPDTIQKMEKLRKMINEYMRS